MAEENIGLFAQVWRFFTFYKLRKALAVRRAADRQFTGSVGGVRDAFDLQQHKLVTQYNEMRDAVSEVEMVIETDRGRFEDLAKSLAAVEVRREGAKEAYKKAKKAGDEAGLAKHRAAFERYQNDVVTKTAKREELAERIQQNEKQMERFMLKLTQMQAEVQRLPEEKAQAIADYVSSEKIIELNDRLSGMTSVMDRGPIDTVLAEIEKKKAKARISEKLAGADAGLQDDEYERAGRSSTAGDLLDEMIAAEEAEEAAKTGTASTKEERPDIG